VASTPGLEGFEAVFWQAMVVPAGTPQPIVDKLQKAIAKIAAEPEMIERFKKQGVEIRSSTQAELKDFYSKEEKRWATLIKEQGIKPE
jgi:tripartite-type tricarboxylate transporter receptor subunit TctC